MDSRDDESDEGEVDPSIGGVNPAMDDYDEDSADVKTYECDDCGHRMQVEHQPETCPNCGGDMIDISVSRE